MDTIERLFFMGVFSLFAVETIKNWSREVLERRDERRRRDDAVDQWIDDGE